MLNWDGLKSVCADCTRCGLCETSHNVVFGVGKEDADIMKTTEWLFAAPNTDAERICKVPARVSIKLLETVEDGWMKIIYQNETGYIRPGRIIKGWGVIMD